MYRVQEIFYTLQGEGAHTGRAAVFLRFAGCNLWTGRPEDRLTAACPFCDTDFHSMSGPLAGLYPDPEALAQQVAQVWNGTGGVPYVVCTGGEPLLQLDTALIAALHQKGFEVAVETNGTVAAPEGLDWICVSPKAGARWVQRTGNELKVVWPQAFDLGELEDLTFGHFYLQPKDQGDERSLLHTKMAVEMCQTRPKWRISLQTHKLLGIP